MIEYVWYYPKGNEIFISKGSLSQKEFLVLNIDIFEFITAFYVNSKFIKKNLYF